MLKDVEITRGLLLIFIFSSGLSVIPFTGFAPAYACSCIEQGSVQEAIDSSDAVFSGKVTAVDNNQGRVNAQFDVESVWKGSVGDQVIVVTSMPGDACGYGFAEGERYLVYANAADPGFNTSICTKTKPLSEAGDDLTVLNDMISMSTQTIPVLHDTNNFQFSSIYLGSSVVISTTIVNKYQTELPFVTIMEARDENGVTEYLQWQTGTLGSNEDVKIGFSWMPQSAGVYQLRTFSVSNFTNPQVLTAIKSTQVAVQATDGYVWMARNTTQCADPWDTEQQSSESDGQTNVRLFFEKRGIAIFDIETVRYLPDDALVCLACNCTSGETLYVKLSSIYIEDMQRYGFVETEPPFE